MDDPVESAAATALPLIQGAYDVLTGIWPLVDMTTFERVTGGKTDRWLVKTVGVLVAAIGSALLVAGSRRRVPPEIVVLGAGSAAGLAAIDAVYVARRRISPIYLLDAVAEVAFVLAWLWTWQRGR